MFKNYFTVAVRNLFRNKLLAVVNISGLSIGLACVMLIMLFVKDEYSFDKFNRKGDRIYRLVQTQVDTSGNESRNGNSGLPHGPAFAAEIPEIETFCRIKGHPMVTKKGNEGAEAKVLFADTSFFSIFSFNIVKGNPATMLRGLNSVVLTNEMADKYFGTANPMGKIVEIEVDEAFEPFIVTGVVKAAPVNSSVRFDMLIPFEKQNPVDAKELADRMNDWNSIYLNTFFLLKKGTDVAKTEKKLAQVYQKYNGKDWEKFKETNGVASLTYFLQPFFSMHLDDRFFASNGLEHWSDSSYSYILSGLAILILLIAAINFINITLARSLKRGKEIGIRKVSGGSRKQLISQFLSESLVVTALAFIPALFLVQLSLPVFSEMTNRHFDINYLFQPGILSLFTALLLLVALLAGFYPAFVASGFQPVQTLYGRFKLNGKNMLGKSLVVLQFVIALALIIGTIVFNRQFTYMTQSDLGYSMENIIRLESPWGKASQIKQLTHELLKEPSIVSIGAKGGDWNKTIFTINQKKTDWTYYETIDDNYLQVLKIPLVKGRYLSYNNTADTVSNCLVNEAFAEQFLDKNKNPIGQLVSRGANNFTVAGIVKNYHSAAFREKIEPIFFSLDKSGSLINTLVKYAPGKAGGVAAIIEKNFKSVFPYTTLRYHFMEDWNRNLYSQDEQWKQIVSRSAFIAILISCLGLFALTALSVEQRIKEIGIRKVLGASAGNITALISKDFLKLVIIALIIASPLAWWVMNKWLQDFVYRVDISWWIFLAAGAIAVVIALLTVGFQAIKAAVANPVKSLRSE